MSNVPSDFKPLFRSSPYTELLGPIYQHKSGPALVIGLHAEDKHCNSRGHVHGGVLCALADIAMGYSAAFSTEPATPMVTVSQTIDYVDKIAKGAWIEIHTDVQKVGQHMAFANCYFHVDAQRIARSSAVFKIVSASQHSEP